MADLKRLLPVFRRHENKCAAIAAAATRQLETLQAQVEQVKQYRDDYQLSHTAVPALLGNTRQFLTRLEDGITELTQRVQKQHLVVAREKLQWQQACAKTKALEKLIQKQTRADTTDNPAQNLIWQNRCNQSD